MLKSQQGSVFFTKSPRFTSFPLGNLRKIGLISRNPFQIYVPFHVNDKNYIKKKEPAKTEVDDTSINEKPKILVDQIGKGQEERAALESSSKIDSAVLDKMMHPQFKTNIYVPPKKKKKVSAVKLEKLQENKDSIKPEEVSPSTSTASTPQEPQVGNGPPPQKKKKLFKFF